MSPSPGLADPVQFAASDPLSAPDLLSPEGIHEYLLRAHRISNELQFKFIQALRALDEGRFFFHPLGFPTIWAYAHEFFGWERSTTYDALQVARALDDLPLTRDRYIGGLAYTRVHQITRIATRETEAEWIEFAEKTTLKRLRIEVSDAKGKGRKKPRKDQYSLPAQRQRLPFDFSPDEFTVLQTALRKKSAELSQDGPPGTPKNPLGSTAPPGYDVRTTLRRTRPWRTGNRRKRRGAERGSRSSASRAARRVPTAGSGAGGAS